MKYTKFTIKNYKGIKELELDLSKNPKSNIFTFVGLNESGKTTILEAINFFQEDIIPVNSHKLIPKSKNSNFNDEVSVAAHIELSEDDEEEIAQFLIQNKFKIVDKIKTIEIIKKFIFKNSKYVSHKDIWKIKINGTKGKSKKEITLNKLDKDEVWHKCISFIKDDLLPPIIYYPNFLSDFPNKIYLEKTTNEDREQSFYREVIQDILDYMNQGFNMEEHIIQRMRSLKQEDEVALASTTAKMGALISKTVFLPWEQLFNSKGKEIVANCFFDDNKIPYIELKLKDGAEYYQISERSLGFKWFFSFLLFTEFRKNRSKDNGEILFLIDEPASNLHSTAQIKLLNSFEKLVSNCKLIYTTHSHHLINPLWLAGAFIVRNKALDYDDELDFDSSKTDIEAILHKKFVANYPDQRAYFQPILDKLEYQPSLLETVPNIIVLEGKNDFYTFKYINEVILKNIDSTLNFYPGAGAGKNSQIIQLYLAWGRDFAVLFDDDKGGLEAKKKYVDEFGALVDNCIFTLADVNENNKGLATENLFSKEEQLEIVRTFDPAAKKYDKSKFNTALQNLYIDKTEIELSEETKNKFMEIFKFLDTSKNE